jgi:hypothetical protein
LIVDLEEEEEPVRQFKNQHSSIVNLQSNRQGACLIAPAARP